MPETSTTSPTFIERLTSEFAIAVLIALLSMATAYAVYQASQLDSRSGDNRAKAMSLLSDSNSTVMFELATLQDDIFFLNQAVLYDDIDQDLSDLAFSKMSPEAQGSFDEDAGWFTDEFMDASFAWSAGQRDEAQKLLDSADQDSTNAGAFQLTVMIMAAGLSFAAWASLATPRSLTRNMFALLALIALVVGIWFISGIPSIG